VYWYWEGLKHMATIIIRISPDGSTTETMVNGIKGAKCTDLTKGLMEALGDVINTEKTSEYYQDELAVVHGGIG
jgi:SLT domain-containing protein